ncbi:MULTISPECIES: 50S ribosomal protein L25 [Paenibacillus]|uniref:Large ribosomal subunit protein bL25 n=1 Tax=Paenibacillus validus TaxID=44253 RepID=A0A7X2ZEC0_9BACL|nr:MULTISPECIES: 50S ribosomal protein L25 [Paenibacillus]MUG73379.1 50S ribosomal protein L25 [Paenibacillus validus]
MATTLKAEARSGRTKGDRNRLRAEGKVPAVVYGKKVPQTSIAIDQKELLALIKANRHAIIELDVPQLGKQPVMINEIQRDAINRQLLHVDFHQINMDEPVNTTVRLEYTGEAIGVQEGGILQIQLHELDIRCLPTQIPSVIEVDVSSLGIGENLLVSSLQLSAGIEIKTNEHDVLATILTPQKAEPETVDEEPGAKTEDAPAEAAAKSEETV